MSDPLFQGSLQDMIKGMRSNKKDPSTFLSKEIADIKTELRSTDPFLKAEAVRKLTYLQMIGYNVSWAAFAIIEVMSQPKFGHKRIGYLAANQSFDENTEVILLTTNLFKKEFSGTLNSTQYEVGVAINSLANIATKDLARDCISDLVLLMNHTKPYIRKKAVLCMYKLYVKYPQGLRLTFEKLKDRLDDAESAVVSTAVNVICELANKNPNNYLAMAPKFFKLLTTSSNNWMLIKVVKLLGALVSEEPRLARKLLDPLCTIIQNTGAKSLQYECIYTLTEALPYSKREDGSDAKNAPAVIKLCSDYLRGFIEDSDQNLKYLGLVGLAQLMKSQPRCVVEHRDLVLQCLNDDDVTIRTKALELLAGIVSRRSLADLVNHLMKHARLAEGAYRDEVISKILYMCKKEKYSLVSDFAWYTSILLELAVMPGSKHGAEVADQLIEVALRVDTVRPYAVETMLTMLLNEQLVLGSARTTVCEVLKAAAWIVGEYSEIVGKISRDRSGSLDSDEADDDDEEEHVFWIEGATGEDIRSAWRGQRVHLLVMDALLHPRAANLPVLVQAVYLQAAVKLFIRAASDCDLNDLADIVGVVRSRLPVFMQHQSLEVQERATTFRHLLAEFDILALNWEEATEEISRETPGAAAVGSHGRGRGNGSGLNDQERQMMDLLEMPMYTQSSVRAVDEYGAKLAIEKVSVLKSITAEEFYAVHSKAQRRVPVPSDIDLEKPLDEAALDELLGIDIPEDLNLNSLSLVHVPQSFHNAYDSGVSKGLYSQNPDGSRSGGLEEANFTDHAKPTPTSSTGAWDHSTVTSGYTTRNSDDVFMLSSNNTKNADIIPLSKILGDNFEDISAPAGRSSSRGGKSHKKSKASKRRGAEVNVVEMVPAGAVDSSDEGSDAAVSRSRAKGSKSRSGGKSSRKKKATDSDEDEIDLGGIDITTPLRKDEVLHVQTHRVVSAQSAPQQGQYGDHQDTNELSAGIAATWHAAEGEGRGEKDKKHKKHGKNKDKDKADKKSSKSGSGSKEKKASKSKGSDPAHQVASLLSLDDSPLDNHSTGHRGHAHRPAEDNLLGLEYHAPAPEPARHAPASANDRNYSMFETMGTSKSHSQREESSVPSSSAHKRDKHDKHNTSDKGDKSSKKKSSVGNFWIPVYGDNHLDIMYAVTSSTSSRGHSLAVQWKVVNNSPNGAAVSVGVHLNSPLLSADPTSRGYVALASNLRGGDAQTEMALGLFNPVEESIALPAQFSISAESLLGQENRTVQGELHATVCASFSPYNISEDDFARALGKSSSKWASGSVEVSVSCKPKTAFKALSGFLRAHVVESESSKAASMCAKTVSGDKVYILAKVSKSNAAAVQLDVKCACGSQQESARIVALVTDALNELSL